MLEFKDNFTHVGYVTENDNTFYALYRNDHTGDIVMENDDTGTTHLVSELAGTDEMLPVMPNSSIIDFIVANMNSMVRGLILLSNGNAVVIYSLGDGTYCYGFNSIYNVEHGVFPDVVYNTDFVSDYDVD